jgi:FkbM family methyltransferase
MALGIKRKLRKAWQLMHPVVRASIGGRYYTAPMLVPNGAAGALLKHARYESWLGALMRELLAFRSGAFVDVGSNVGQTLLKVLEVDSQREFIGFEPQVSSCAAVVRFIHDNQLRHHRVLPLALGEAPGFLELGSRNENDVSASVVPKYRPEHFHPTKTPVPVACGDAVLESLGIAHVAAMKVDVEGGELGVFKGFSNLLALQKPPIVFELLPNRLLLTGEPLDQPTKLFRAEIHDEMYAFLIGLGYTISIIDEHLGALQNPTAPLDRLVADELVAKNCIALSLHDSETWRLRQPSNTSASHV